MSEGNNSSTNESFPPIPYNVHFWSYLIVLIPSIICSSFTLYQLIFDRTLRSSLHNHIIIIVLSVCLLCQLTIYPWTLNFYYLDGVWERPFVFCAIWAFLDWVLYVLQTLLFAWATIERHILIFHDSWVVTKKKRVFFHYLPPVIIIMYCIIYHVIIDIFPPCENYYSNDNILCVAFCIYDATEYLIWDTVVHQSIPGLIIIIFSIGLLVRVIRQKIRMRQPVQWRKHRKMTVQLLAISSIYVIFYFPYVSAVPLFFYGGKQYYNTKYILSFVAYFMILFLSFSCAFTLPDFHKRLRNLIKCGRRSQTIAPIHQAK